MEGIGNILYSVISEIGKEKIQSDITLNIELSRPYILMILDRCKKLVNLENEEYIGSLCEALMHFMLTTCTLPSGRKVRIDNINLDIVIPSLHTLRNYPEKAIVIQIVKDSKIITGDRQKNITKIQPNANNLWIVTREPLIGDYVNYTVESGNNKNTTFLRRNFHDIIVDIDTFLEQTKDRSFRFFH
jgi:hypothetical protein